MTVLTVAVVLVGTLCLLDLVLTLGVIRRLRDHSQRLSLPADGDTAGKPGSVVDPFTATTTDDTNVARDDLVEPTLVGFFSPDCPACEEKLPAYLEYARSFPGPKLGVIAGEAGGLKYRTALTEIGAVVVERELGPVQKAFGVSGFPAFVIVVDGVIAQAGHEVADLPEHELV